jgi:transposase
VLAGLDGVDASRRDRWAKVEVPKAIFARFTKPRSVGAHLDLTLPGYQSGEVGHGGPISKHGDALLRSYLLEGAGVMLNHVTQRWPL